MLRFDRSQQGLAVGIAMLAGFVDGIGFVESSGFFVSFMTGNSTRLAVGAAEGGDAGPIAGVIILLFVGGVVAGSLIGARYPTRRAAAVLAAVSLFLLAAFTARRADSVVAAIACLAVAMGCVNAALQARDGQILGVTYMTGTLVQMGQKLANRLLGKGDGRWAHHFGLWLALVAGAIVGAWAAFRFPVAAHGAAALAAIGLALFAYLGPLSPGRLGDPPKA